MITTLIICAIILAIYLIVLAVAIGTEAFLATRESKDFEDDANALCCNWPANRLSYNSRQVA